MRATTADTENVEERAQLRQQIVRIVENRFEPIVNDTVAVFPFTGPAIEAADSRRVCELALALLVEAVRDGEADPRSTAVADLRQFAHEHGVGIPQLFGLIYLLERMTLDEAALDESLGATSEQWPGVAQAVRRGSIDCLAAFAEHITTGLLGSVFDPLTTVYTRAVLDAVLEKELHRAERFKHPFALVLLDVDRLSDVNAAHGYGFGDRVLERIGIVMRNYFREQDWVARKGEDSFAVVLPETAAEHAELLAEKVRTMVEERLSLRDHRTDEIVQVTVSVAVLIAESVSASLNAAQVILQAEQAVYRAKYAGRNRVERIVMQSEPDGIDQDDARRRHQDAES